jgi:hypothetical protein
VPLLNFLFYAVKFKTREGLIATCNSGRWNLALKMIRTKLHNKVNTPIVPVKLLAHAGMDENGKRPK